jgi:hypothetical protein
MWKNFLEQMYNPNAGKSKLVQFREYFQKEMERRLTAMPDLGYEDDTPETIIISMLTFAFDNAKVIELLQQRGDTLRANNYDQMRVINKKLDDLKQKDQVSLNRPVTAFLTLENEEGLNRALAYSETVEADD